MVEVAELITGVPAFFMLTGCSGSPAGQAPATGIWGGLGVAVGVGPWLAATPRCGPLGPPRPTPPAALTGGARWLAGQPNPIPQRSI